MTTNLLYSDLPDVPGVYLFYDAIGTLLYVGKSVSVRSRVRSHFADRSEKRMCRRIRRIEVRRTAGELGALLLESHLIKDLRPLFNVAQRRHRRIVIARRVENPGGYGTVMLQAIDQLAFNPSTPILGVFKHHAQAREFLDGIAHAFRLCPKLLRLEQARNYCFAYHLKQCDGACMGEEPPERYNERLEQAFEERRIKAWPYQGPLAVQERSTDGTLEETFVVDNWCLLGSLVKDQGVSEQRFSGSHRFDYDAYKILFAFIVDAKPTITLREAAGDEMKALMTIGERTSVRRGGRRNAAGER